MSQRTRAFGHKQVIQSWRKNQTANAFRADRFKRAVTRSGLTNKEIHEKLGLSPGAISHWTGGRTAPCLDNLVKLAQFLYVTTDWLLGTSDICPACYTPDNKHARGCDMPEACGECGNTVSHKPFAPRPKRCPECHVLMSTAHKMDCQYLARQRAEFRDQLRKALGARDITMISAEVMRREWGANEPWYWKITFKREGVLKTIDIVGTISVAECVEACR